MDTTEYHFHRDSLKKKFRDFQVSYTGYGIGAFIVDTFVSRGLKNKEKGHILNFKYLVKEGKVAVQLIAGKLNFQIKKDINQDFRLFSVRGSMYIEKYSAADATAKTTQETRRCETICFRALKTPGFSGCLNFSIGKYQKG